MNMLRGTSDLHPDEGILRFLIQALRAWVKNHVLCG